MSADATADMIKAVRAKLIADSTINTAVSGRVYSDWSTGATLPLIRISVPIAREWEDDCGEGSELDLRVHVFAAGLKARSDLASQVRNALRSSELSLDTAYLRQITWDQTINMQDPDDPSLFTAVVRFNAITSTKP